MTKHPEGGGGVEARKPFEEGFAPDTTMDTLHRPRGNRVECDGCEQRRECVPVGEEVLCAECILARTIDHERGTTQKPDEEESAACEAAAHLCGMPGCTCHCHEPDEEPEGPGQVTLEAISQELTGLHNGTAPDRGVHYQDGWRHGVAQAQDVVLAALGRLKNHAKGTNHGDG